MIKQYSKKQQHLIFVKTKKSHICSQQYNHSRQQLRHHKGDWMMATLAKRYFVPKGFCNAGWLSHFRVGSEGVKMIKIQNLDFYIKTNDSQQNQIKLENILKSISKCASPTKTLKICQERKVFDARSSRMTPGDPVMANVLYRILTYGSLETIWIKSNIDLINTNRDTQLII